MTAVLLDAMGTLVTFAPPAPRLRALLAERHGIRVTEAEARAAMKAEIAFYRREHDVACDAEGLAALRRACAEVLRDALPPAAHALDPDALVPTLVDSIVFSAFAEVPGVLEELTARGHRLAVVSNWDVSLRDVLDSLGLSRWFGAVAISAELGYSKPHPAPFRAALDALGVAAADAVHVGDRPEEDVAGARAAGVAPVLVDRDGTLGAQDAPVISDLRGLLALT